MLWASTQAKNVSELPGLGAGKEQRSAALPPCQALARSTFYPGDSPLPAPKPASTGAGTPAPAQSLPKAGSEVGHAALKFLAVLMCLALLCAGSGLSAVHMINPCAVASC